MSESKSDGSDHEKLRERFGIAFEEENAQADLERWRDASDGERSRVIVALIERAEQIAAATGIRNEEPAPRFPVAGPRVREGDGS